jgi:hypothetical protein
MIIKKEKKGNITIYYVDKDYPDNQVHKLLNKKLRRNQIQNIIYDDADVYTKDGKLLLRFRKNKLKKENIEKFYKNVINFAQRKTNNRGSAVGSKSKNVYDNPKIMTNILGYFDKFSPIQKLLLKQQGKQFSISVRPTRFNMDYPEKFKEILPLVKEIDHYYKLYAPDHYKKQRSKANQTPFKIDGTAFTTITTNVNFQTTTHTDKGDDDEGFGNLVVIEEGKYSGGETCLPQYGIGVDVRTGDVLFMDVHELHGNLPIVLETKDAKRLSIVCYLRKNIWTQTKNKSKKFMIQHNETIKNLRKPKGANKTRRSK